MLNVILAAHYVAIKVFDFVVHWLAVVIVILFLLCKWFLFQCWVSLYSYLKWSTAGLLWKPEPFKFDEVPVIGPDDVL